MAETTSKLEDVLIQVFKGSKNPQPDNIAKYATQLASVLAPGIGKEELEAVIKRVEARFVTTMSEGISLVDPDTDHDEEWHQKRKDITWDYWEDYERQLISDKWGPQVVSSLGDVTEKILGLLKNPQEPGDWDRRGLVIGHVQSGKTANYIGLISKAADAGYKFIIVIAGIHNDLRNQTQQRIDEGFIGRDSTPGKGRKTVGVGLINPNRRYPVSFTTISQDFSTKIANQLGASLRDFSKPVVVVIKKNVRTIQNLRQWLKAFNPPGAGNKIAVIPMLMIDDEADHASINTRRTDLEPTQTNKEIRGILSLFRKSCYIGYTATPFANIFINPDTKDEMLEDDLFPRDFIYCLDAPSNYFGPGKVFSDDDVDNVASSSILKIINDAEDHCPLKHEKTLHLEDIPPSMKRAINVFIIGKAVRLVRGQSNKHCSMMINASRFVDVQRQIKEKVAYYIKTIALEVRYSYKLPNEEALRNEHLATLKKVYDEEFSALKETWPSIQRVIFDAVDSIATRLINSQSGEILDYKPREEKNESLTVIAVGGLSLSRGLTLEGLTVSYMYRNTKMYDTLMQMGRWFGYRGDYEDLCRIWLSDESQEWYRHIAQATEELLLRTKQMQRERLPPKDFGLYVRAHPDALMVTALNKMRDTQLITFNVHFSGVLVETVIVPSDDQITKRNLLAIRDLFEKLSTDYPDHSPQIQGAYYWEGVNWKNIDDFLFKFRFHELIESKKKAILKYLYRFSAKFQYVDIAFISRAPKDDTSFIKLGREGKLFCQERSVGTTNGEIKRPAVEQGFFISNRQRMSSRGVEAVGLSKEQRAKAKKHSRGAKNVSDQFYRTVREKPLLMIHALKLVHKNEHTGKKILCLDQVPGIGISFPYDVSTIFNPVEYVVNKVGLQQDLFDAPDEEDDYGN